MSAWAELIEYLDDGEVIEAICFGAWGWGSAAQDGKDWTEGYGEPTPPPVPFEIRGKPLQAEVAEPLMQSWCFYGGYGAPDCYATYIWTNRHVIWVTQYDGSTGLDRAPRNPLDVMPEMPGG